jgi:hypothetical protein
MSKKYLIAAAVIGNIAALAVLFWLVLDMRGNGQTATRTIYEPTSSSRTELDSLLADATRQALCDQRWCER